jgi:hypothetical protein
MANKDFPRGLWPAGHLCGGAIRSHRYTLTTGEIIRRGEVVKAVAGGTVEDAAAGDGAIVVGVSADYVDDSASAGGKTVNIYDDPNIIFGVQASVAITAVAVFSTSDLTTCASSNQYSDTELDLDSNGQCKIIGLVEEPENSWLINADILVIFNEHLYKALVAGV